MKKVIQTNKLHKNQETILALKVYLPSASDDELLNIYNTSISIHQSKNSKIGSFLEKEIETFLINSGIPYKSQVTIDKYGIIIDTNKKNEQCYHIVDFVIGEGIDIGSSIQMYKVISCKTTCRERWTQDNWSFDLPPVKFILMTISNDYPSSVRFRETEQRKILTICPKNKDTRRFKLSFNDLLNEL